jgi:chorismate mutase
MQKELDLKETLRPGLDILANEIVISLKKRSRFKQNPEIYKPGLVLGRADISLLEYELGRIEQLHAELGRYTYANQESYSDISGVDLIINRPPPESPICNYLTKSGPRIIEFYITWIKDSCLSGTDSNTYGESVTSDVNALLNILERVNLGKYVAEYKFRKNPEIFRKTRGDAEQIRNLIVKPEREKKVLEMASRLGEHYDFNREQAVNIFQWMIKTTVCIEIEYIRRRLGQ